MVNETEIQTTTQENNNITNNSNNMINNNNTFHGGLIIGLLGSLIVLGCLLPLCKLKSLKKPSNNKLAPLQQRATLIK